MSNSKSLPTDAFTSRSLLPSQSRRLRALLDSPKVEHILEAHNAVGATIVEEAGIRGLWASSLTLSCAYGLRDNSELTMTEVLDMLESITAKVDIPILFDGDTGYGQFSHFQQLVRKLILRRVGGVCIEDKVFPKTNSFLRSEGQELAPVDEFCGKIRAGKDAQTDPDFVIAARTESLIVGLDISAALHRAERYAEAGADAVLIHSKARNFAPIQEFMTRWSGAVPVIIVPTTYYSTPIDAFQQAGISLVIWANHMLRASIGAMQNVAQRIAEAGTARDLEDEIVSVKEVFRLQDADGLLEGERVYLSPGSQATAVLLAASRGSGMDELTADKPKCMIQIAGTPAIEKMLQNLRAEGIKDISIVRGYKPEALKVSGVNFFDNANWEQTGELGSLQRARDVIKGETIVAYGDIVAKRYILHELLSAESDITIVVDGTRTFLGSNRAGVDRVQVSAPAPLEYDEETYHLLRMADDIPDAEVSGEWIGMARTKGEGTEKFKRALDAVLAEPGGDELDMAAVFNRLIADDPECVKVIYVKGDWIDINSLADVAQGYAR